MPRGTAIIPDLSLINGNGGISALLAATVADNVEPDLGAYYRSSSRRICSLDHCRLFNVTNTQRGSLSPDATDHVECRRNSMFESFFGSGQIFQYPSAIRLGAVHLLAIREPYPTIQSASFCLAGLFILHDLDALFRRQPRYAFIHGQNQGAKLIVVDDFIIVGSFSFPTAADDNGVSR